MNLPKAVYTFDEVKAVYSTYIKDPKDLAKIEEAYRFAEKKHDGQFRKSGDPYITHCLGVAEIIAELQGGPTTIRVGLLHDTIEDTGTTKQEINDRFGPEVADMVEALTKVTRLSDYKNVEFTAENHRKIFVARAKDIRVIIVKLADRLHNRRTLQFQPEHKQVSISEETLEVYAPIAHRLGLYKVQTELEDLSLYYTKPEIYKQIEEWRTNSVKDAKAALNELKSELSLILQKSGIPFEITDRVKSVYSIYKKRYTKHHTFEQIYDLLALRIVTSTEQQCYEILGYVHANFKPVPGRFKDYIARPKPNRYQSLHTTVRTSSGRNFEIQIRTRQMDEIAEGGVAAHWRYKEGSNYDPRKEQAEIENQLHWFKDFVSFTAEDNDDNAKEYRDALSHDIFDANVYVFTPKGNVICLPNGATPIDFAYRIHSDLGDHLSGSKVNGVLVPISTALKTGDIVEVITGKNASPNSEWLNRAKTGFAKTKIRKYLVKVNADFVKENLIKRGKQTLVDSLRERKISVDPSQVITKKVLDTFDCDTPDELYVKLGGRSISASQIIETSENVSYTSALTGQERADRINSRGLSKVNTTDSVVLENGDSIRINLANCCRPIPGDDIIGFVSTGQGVKIHRADCPNVTKNPSDSRLIKVRWNPSGIKEKEFPVDLEVECHDRDKLLVDLRNSLSAVNCKVTKINAKYHSSNSSTTIELTIRAKDKETLDSYISAISSVKSVFQIYRKFH